MIEEPYTNTGLSFIEYDRGHTVHHIRWIDEFGNERETPLSKEEAEKWFGYSFLSAFCNREILILK